MNEIPLYIKNLVENTALALVRAIFILVVFVKYYCIKQHDITDYASTCLATICKQNGYKVEITRIREFTVTDKQATNA